MEKVSGMNQECGFGGTARRSGGTIRVGDRMAGMEGEAKIADAVTKCVAYATESDRKFRQIADFLLILKADGWTDDELISVKTRAICELGKKYGIARDFGST
jgi:hypothetical protein